MVHNSIDFGSEFIARLSGIDAALAVTLYTEPPMSTEFDPQRLDVAAFARAGVAISGRSSLSQYERIMAENIAESLQKSDGKTADDVDPYAVQWTAQAELCEPVGSAPSTWLALTAQASVRVTCQRCLTSMDLPLTVNNRFRFVADEAMALEQDDGCDEDLLVSSRIFDLHALVEDELLLALPMVPMHSICPVPVVLEARDADFADESAPAANPFAMLAGLGLGKPT
jgi:uncharacterized protein